MTKKKFFKVILLIIVLVILLIPLPRNIVLYKDGGTKTYTTPIYKVVVWHSLDADDEDGSKTGIEIHFFPNNFHSLDYYEN